MTAYAGYVDVDWGKAESSTSAHRSGTQTRAKADPTRPQAGSSDGTGYAVKNRAAYRRCHGVSTACAS